MTRNIEIVENKVLKLKNVLSKEFKSTGPEESQRSTYLFESYMKSKGLEPYGPLVIKVAMTYENGGPQEKRDIMVQLRNAPDTVEPPHTFMRSIRVENCLLARYRGELFNLPMASRKIQVYAFENDIDLSGDVYTAIVEQNEIGILADVFAVMRT